MMNFKKNLLTVGAGLTFAGSLLVFNPSEASAEEMTPETWVPRTVEEIKADLKYEEDKSTEYTFRWGDTLSALARATDLSTQKLVQINDINDANLIFVGHSIYLSGDHSVVTVEKDDEVVSYDVSGEVEEVTEVETPEEIKETVKEKKATKDVSAKESSTPQGKTITVEATAYSTNQPSLGDITYSGINLRENPHVIAVDPNVIPLGSKVYIPGFGTYIAGDTGSAIKGNRIDIHITDLDAAWAFGRQTMEVTIVE